LTGRIGARRPLREDAAAVEVVVALVPEVVRTAPIDLNHPGHVISWGVVQISVANLIVILVMLAVFALALLLPFPKDKSGGPS
jgi:hypothetical protein